MIDLSKLAAPFPPEKISWRAQTVTKDGTKALALAYIDARDVQDRLDQVCGPENWECRYPHASAKTVCEIGIRVPRGEDGFEWVFKADGAGDSDIEAEKGALSDAFKRAAVKWGIARYLYDIESPWVPCESYKRQDGKFAFSKFTDDPWKYVKNAPKAAPPKQANGKGFHLVDPKTSTVSVIERGGAFLDELEHKMAQGDPSQWWAVNGATAKMIAEKFPQAAKRVEQLQQMAMLPV